MTAAAALQPRAPKIAQLKTGEWVVANMEETRLWDAVFTGENAKYDALLALTRYYQDSGMTLFQAYCRAAGAMP